MSKVVLPKEITLIVRSRCSDDEIFTMNLYRALGSIPCSKDSWINQEGNIEKLIDALRNGYEVEKTPEEKLLYLYQCDPYIRDESRGFKTGIEVALNTLGITVEGINDK